MSVDIFGDNSGIINGSKTGELQITLSIVCVYCGDERGTVIMNYKSDKDQGLFRAKCICEDCIKVHGKSLENKDASL